MATVQYLVPITDTVSGDTLLTAAVMVDVSSRPARELLAAGRGAQKAADAAGYRGPGRTIHIGKAVRLN